MSRSIVAQSSTNLGLHLGKVHNSWTSSVTYDAHQVAAKGVTILGLPKACLEVIQGQVGDRILQIVNIHGELVQEEESQQKRRRMSTEDAEPLIMLLKGFVMELNRLSGVRDAPCYAIDMVDTWTFPSAQRQHGSWLIT